MKKSSDKKSTDNAMSWQKGIKTTDDKPQDINKKQRYI